MSKSKYVITDRKYKKWNERCQHETGWKKVKVCNRKLDEDTGECPLKHGTLLHGCKTECCGVLVSGNHNYCRYHRKKKVKTICKIQDKIMKEFRKRMWGKHYQNYNMDNPEGRKDFEMWKMKQLMKSYDPEVVEKEMKEQEGKEMIIG